MERIKESCVSPLIVEFTVPLRPNDQQRAFLNVPWELLADTNGHWAKRGDLLFTPVRRFGKRSDPLAASQYRLSTVFMAASPRDVQMVRFGALQELHFEEEEAALLHATDTVGMDLVVEESGTLAFLEHTLAAEKNVDIVHISCHGTTEPSPRLVLEDEYGNRSDAEAKDVADKIQSTKPKLLFLSACETGTPGRTVHSLAVTMIQTGLPAVLGWAGSVGDAEAIQFSAGLYHRLSLGQSLDQAVGGARLQLLDTNKEATLQNKPSRDWHLARLYLGPQGGGALSGGQTARKRDATLVHKAFLDQVNRQVPVAAPHEFVGRRRQIQKILTAFRRDSYKGVYVHGVGRQGKSSLAARIALRMSDYRLIVLHGKYDELSILNAFAGAGTDKTLRDFLADQRQEVQDHPERFAFILRELLENHFRDLKRDERGQITQRPALLVIDDFEQALEEQAGQPHRISPDLLPAVRGVLLAFRNAETTSRMLFTSRYTFSLVHDGRDLAQDLLDLSLPPMEEYEARKQASAKQRIQQDAAGTDQQGALSVELTANIIKAALGNPGLQDLLFRLAVENPEACDEAVSQLQAYIDGGTQPNQEQLLAFLENLAITKILALLTPSEQELLRVSSLFELPIPASIFASFCNTAGLGDPEDAIAHLLGLGVWDQHEDPVRVGGVAVTLSPIMRPLAGTLEDAECEAVITSLLPSLYEAWHEADEAIRSYPAHYELARLALVVGNTEIIRTTTESAIRWLANRNEHRKAATLGKQAIALLDTQQEEISADILRVSGEQAESVGDVGFARECFNRAVKALENTDDVDPIDLGAALLSQARRLVREGQPDEALTSFHKVKDLFNDPRHHRERAVTLGDIARILVSKGQVDEAMQLQQERLTIFEQLGDTRSRAVTLGDIARILVSKGQVDEAMQLQQERLTIFEQLGDTRSRAVTLGDIARILVSKGQVDEAMQLQQERLSVNEQLGDQDGKAAALRDIATIEIQQQSYQSAFDHLAESYKIFLEIGRLEGICVVGLDLGQLLCGGGQQEQGLSILKRSQEGFTQLGQEQMADHVQRLIEQVESSPEEE